MSSSPGPGIGEPFRPAQAVRVWPLGHPAVRINNPGSPSSWRPCRSTGIDLGPLVLDRVIVQKGHGARVKVADNAHLKAGSLPGDTVIRDGQDSEPLTVPPASGVMVSSQVPS